MGCGSGKAAPVAVDHREEMDHRDQNGSAAAAAAAAAAAVPKAVAFEVVLDDQAASGTPKAKPPERLQVGPGSVRVGRCVRSGGGGGGLGSFRRDERP